MTEVKKEKALKFTPEEQRFINNARLVTKQALGDIDITTEQSKKENILLVINKYRAMGELMPRRKDGGKQFDLWEGLREKLGSPVKTHAEIQKEQAEITIRATYERDLQFLDDRIKKLQTSLKNVRAQKTTMNTKIEATILAELDLIELKKLEKEKKLEMVRTSRERELKNRQDDVEKMTIKERGEGLDKERKCWECGQWIKVAGGAFTKHIRENKCKEK